MDEQELLRAKLLDELTDDEVEVEKIVQLTRIADALEKIEKTGVYVYQQGTEPTTEEKAETGRRRG